MSNMERSLDFEDEEISIVMVRVERPVPTTRLSRFWRKLIGKPEPIEFDHFIVIRDLDGNELHRVPAYE